MPEVLLPGMRFLGTGLSGLVGSRIVELLSPRHTFVNFSLESGVDITHRDDITARIVKDEAPWVLHLAAYTNVQQAEADKMQGENSPAWNVNVAATQYIVDACQASGKRLLYVDTDYAFDGTKKEYTETDATNPLGWYAITKSEGARRVLAMDKRGLVMRISNPYRANPVGKTDFVHKMLERLQNGQEIVAPSDQLFVPTFIDDIANAMEKLVMKDANGIYHVVGSEAVSPFQAASIVAETYGLDKTLVKETAFAEFFRDRAPIPQYAVLRNDKIANMGIIMRGFAEGMAEVKRQEQT